MPFYTQASCHFAPFGLLKHSVQVSSKQDEQDSAEWMSMSCCCSPVVCQCCLINPWHLSQFNMDNPLHLLSRSLFPPPQSPPSLYRPSHSPVTHESLPDLCLSEEHPSTWRWEKSGWGFQIRPMNTYKHTLLHIHLHINTPTSSHCMGQRGSLKVRDWSLLFSSGCLSVSDSFLWGPASTHKYHV